MENKELIYKKKQKKNWISPTINFPDTIRQHDIIYIASTFKKNDVYISICIEYQKDGYALG